MAYTVPDLPYPFEALEPHIDSETMHLHHDRHHQAYVDKVNAALEGTEFANQPIEEVLRSPSMIPDDKRSAVRNNGGGHYNHSLFWGWMSPPRRRRARQGPGERDRRCVPGEGRPALRGGRLVGSSSQDEDRSLDLRRTSTHSLRDQQVAAQREPTDSRQTQPSLSSDWRSR
jgi:Iron/manganese superoxide dismutases, alpha-hairpin domain